MNGVIKGIVTVFSVVAGLLILTFSLFIALYPIERAKCLASFDEYNPEYTMFGGCRIGYNGKMTPTKIIRDINLK